jgi:hypothetical protein
MQFRFYLFFYWFNWGVPWTPTFVLALMLGLFKVCYLLFKKYLLSEISHAIFSLNLINEVKYRNFLKGSNSFSLLFYFIGLIIFSLFFSFIIKICL